MTRPSFDVLRDVLAAGVATLSDADRATLAAGYVGHDGRTTLSPVYLDRLRSDLPRLLGLPPVGWTAAEYEAALAEVRP